MRVETLSSKPVQTNGFPRRNRIKTLCKFVNGEDGDVPPPHHCMIGISRNRPPGQISGQLREFSPLWSFPFSLTYSRPIWFEFWLHPQSFNEYRKGKLFKIIQINAWDGIIFPACRERGDTVSICWRELGDGKRLFGLVFPQTTRSEEDASAFTRRGTAEIGFGVSVWTFRASIFARLPEEKSFPTFFPSPNPPDWAEVRHRSPPGISWDASQFQMHISNEANPGPTPATTSPKHHRFSGGKFHLRKYSNNGRNPCGAPF